MPRIGGKPKAAKPVVPVTERFAPPTAPVNPFKPVDPLAASAESARQQTVESLVKAKKRVWNTKGRIRRAKFMAGVIALRLEGYSPADTADILGVSRDQVYRALQTCRKDADMSNQLLRLDQIGVPTAVDNVLTGIANGDKEYTLRLLDGRGAFRTHKSIEAQITKTVLTMRVDVTMPLHLVGQAVPVARPGSIVGSPVTIDVPALPASPVVIQTPAGSTRAIAGAPDLT